VVGLTVVSQIIGDGQMSHDRLPLFFLIIGTCNLGSDNVTTNVLVFLSFSSIPLL
jgi:hypothetical protein